MISLKKIFGRFWNAQLAYHSLTKFIIPQISILSSLERKKNQKYIYLFKKNIQTKILLPDFEVPDVLINS